MDYADFEISKMIIFLFFFPNHLGAYLLFLYSRKDSKLNLYMHFLFFAVS